MIIDNRDYNKCMYGTCLYDEEPECRKKECEAYLENPNDMDRAMSWEELRNL